MNRLVFMLSLLLLSSCEDPEIRELKQQNAEQRQQVDKLLQAHQSTVDELAVHLNRQAQQEAEQHTESRNHELCSATVIILGCALAVTLALLLRKGGARATGDRP